MNAVRRSLMNAKTSAGNYIVFEDSAVEAICIANWSSDGIGLTYEDAAVVTNIGNTFKDNTSIVAFNEFQYFTSIATLGAQAFMNCTALEKITLPVSCWKISPPVNNCGSFWGCSNLQKVDAQGLTTIEYAAFNGCVSLYDFDAPNLKSVGWSAFKNCVSLHYFNQPKVTSVNATSFEGSGIKVFNLPLLTGTFHINSCLEVEEVYADDVTTLTTDNTKNTNLRKVMCKNLTSVPNFVTLTTHPLFNSSEIDVMYMPKLTAFPAKSYKYKKYYFPMLQSSSGNQFNGSTIELIDMGENMTSITGYLLTNISAANMANINVICRATTPPTMANTISNYSNRIPKAVYVPASSVNTYKTASKWDGCASVIYAIGGAEWIAEFGSADEYADYPNDIKPN